MASVNKVILIGNLGADPEVRTIGNGNTVCELSVATARKYKDKAGAYVDETEWSKVVVWGKQAEACGQYLAKGRQVYIEGRLKTEKWQDKEGKDRYTAKIVADNFGGVVFLGKGEGAPAKPASERRDWGDNTTANPEVAEDDIPF